MARRFDDLEWELRTTSSLEALAQFALWQRRQPELAELAEPYDLTDVSPFSPSSAVYFMDGFSDAWVTLRGSGEELSFAFEDSNTSIAASAPALYDEAEATEGLYVPVPPPLEPTAFYPLKTPAEYRRDTTMHLLQVVSMNMRSLDERSSLLIGLPYAERYPELFFHRSLLESGPRGGASYGVVQSITAFPDPATGERTVTSNGYPARSFFAIYHVIETPAGVLFNKKATQMELQPNREGKLATKLPPIPFIYRLLNGPIPLFDADDPNGEPVADLISAMHGSHKEASQPSSAEWPYRQPDLEQIQKRIDERGSK